MKLAIIGSRKCGGLTVKTILENIPSDTTSIISGGAMGVDSMAREVAKILRLPFEEILPDYDVFGKTAPLVRNKAIVDRADMVIAFWDYESRGTRHALLESLKQDKKIKIVLIGKGKLPDNFGLE